MRKKKQEKKYQVCYCIFAPPSERWHRVRSQRCKSKSVCYRTSPRLVNAAAFSWNAMVLLPLHPVGPDLSTVKPDSGCLRFLELSWSSFAASSSSMASPAAKGSAAEAAAAATLPLVSEEVASAPAPSDMAQRMMCVSWLCVEAALFRCV